jgi:hypothetical protein
MLKIFFWTVGIFSLSSCAILPEIQILSLEGRLIAAASAEARALAALELRGTATAASVITEGEAVGLLSRVRISNKIPGRQRLVSTKDGKHLGDLLDNKTILWKASNAKTIFTNGNIYKINSRQLGVKSEFYDLKIMYHLEKEKLVLVQETKGKFSRIRFTIDDLFYEGWVPSDSLASIFSKNEVQKPEKKNIEDIDCSSLHTGTAIFNNLSGNPIEIRIYEYDQGRNGNFVRSINATSNAKAGELNLPIGMYNWEAKTEVLREYSGNLLKESGNIQINECKSSLVSIGSKTTTATSVMTTPSVGDYCFTNDDVSFTVVISFYQRGGSTPFKQVDLSPGQTTCLYDMQTGVHKLEMRWKAGLGGAQYMEYRVEGGKKQTSVLKLY